jgi:hypothetical protein
MKLLYFFALLVLVLISCEHQEKKQETTLVVTRDSLAFSQRKKVKVKTIVLQPNAKKALQNWKEYTELNEFIARFYTISSGEALSNAEELTDLATHLKDSIQDEKLKQPAVITRFNIFQNECLRLKDMEHIPAITEQEVNTKVKEILEAYAGIKAKLNSVYEVSTYENNLKLDPDFEKILIESGLDTTKVAPSKKPRDNKRYDKFKKKKKPKKTSGFVRNKKNREQE